MVASVSQWCKRHKRGLLFVTVAAAAGYASWRAMAVLSAEIEMLKRGFGPGEIGPDAPFELQSHKLEQLLLQAQLASDQAVASLLPALARRVAELAPSLTAAQLRERMASCQTTQQKTALIQQKAASILLQAALSLYGMGLLALTFKSTYAVAASFMATSEDPANVAAEAELLASRVTKHLLESEQGLAALSVRLAAALDDALLNWPIQKKCIFLDFQDFWKNVRFAVEDVSFDASPAIMFTPGEAVRHSVLKHVFPFPADGIQESGFSMRVDAALLGAETLDVMKNLFDRLFLEFFRHVEPRFDPSAPVPLVRVAPAIQSEVTAILAAASEEYFTESVLRNERLHEYVAVGAGLDHSPNACKHILYVCDLNVKESVIASALTRLHGFGRPLEVYSCGLREDEADQRRVSEDVVDSLALLGVDVAHHVPVGLRSIPRDVVFDVVVVIGPNADPLACSSIATKKTAYWDFSGITAADDVNGLRHAMDERVRQLLTEI